jgi:hypothetical protein
MNPYYDANENYFNAFDSTFYDDFVLYHELDLDNKKFDNDEELEDYIEEYLYNKEKEPEFKRTHTIYIYDRDMEQNIKIRTAIDRGIVKNPNRFILPKNKVLIPDGKTKKYITPFQADILVKKGKLKENKIIYGFLN